MPTTSPHTARLFAKGDLLVVETDDTYLGTAEALGSVLVVRSGFVGRHTIVPLAHVVSLGLASAHPLVGE